jgi:hypothetical protein
MPPAARRRDALPLDPHVCAGVIECLPSQLQGAGETLIVLRDLPALTDMNTLFSRSNVKHAP